MCTVLTVSSDFYGRGMFNRITSDAIMNADGFALLLIDAFGASTMIRTLDFRVVTMMLEQSHWERMFLHCRYATQGEAVLDNTHGWSVDGVFYMHNGVLEDPETRYFAVDSQLIGHWLYGGVEKTIEKLQKEPYANVFLIDTKENYYVVHRSKGGTLFTDWKGNYSTNKMGPIRHPVPLYSQNSYFLEVSEPLVPNLPNVKEGL
jgi:hypothetical protein